MGRKFIVVEVTEREDFPEVFDHTEALFNMGIGAPELDPREGWVDWPHMVGCNYQIVSITVADTLRPSLTNVEEVYKK